MRGLVICLATLTACSGDAATPPDAPPPPDGTPLVQRPAGTPDVLILSVSGHSDILGLATCSGDNITYLDGPGDAVEALVQLFVGLGLTVETAHFADRLEAPAADPQDPARQGFVELVATLEAAFLDWIDGFSNPTRIVIVDHSHGSNWAHIATSILNAPVEYLITLDGICTLWECEHETDVFAWVTANGLFAWDISRPCNRWAVPGQAGLRDTKDVVFQTVRFHLEVQSSSLFPSDGTDNYRIDGSDGGIFRLASTEGHGGVHLAAGSSMAWVMNTILGLEGG